MFDTLLFHIIISNTMYFIEVIMYDHWITKVTVSKYVFCAIFHKAMSTYNDYNMNIGTMKTTLGILGKFI